MRNPCLAVLTICVALPASGAPRCEVRAGGDAQACINRATGGDPATVWFAPGEHKIKTLTLRSNVTLELAAGATLSASINGDGVTDVAIVGRDRGTSLLRGFVSLRNCRRVRMQGFTQEGGNGQGYANCADVTLTSVTIRQPRQRHGGGSAIWFIDCKNVTGTDCDLSSNDDVWCVKRSGENIHLKDSTLTGHLAAPFKIGTETDGAIRNISMTNCTIKDSDRGAISIESVDGADIDGVFISGIRMNNVATPLFIRLGDRGRYGKPAGSIRNVRIENVEAVGLSKDDGIGSAISGLPGRPVEGVTISKLRAVYRGGGSAADALRQPKEFPAAYPEYDMFGKLPAYGLFVRHAKGITLRDVSLGFSQKDLRPALIAEDVDGLTLDGFSAMAAQEAESAIRLDGVLNLVVLRPTAGLGVAFIGHKGFASVGEALDAAAPGDTVRVMPGRSLLEPKQLPLTIRAPGVTLVASAGPERTVFEARGASDMQGKQHSLLLIAADGVVVDGFTLRGGVYSVYAEGVRGAAVRNCLFDGSKRFNAAFVNTQGARLEKNRSRGSGIGMLLVSGGGGATLEGNLSFEDPAGMALRGASDNSVRNNRFDGPSWYGLEFTNSHRNAIEGNVVDGGRLSGLQLRAATDNRISGNTFSNNKTEGVLIERGSSGNVFRNNNIFGNRSMGLANEAGADVDAALNWWGSPEGPTAVDANVSCRPWLKAPVPAGGATAGQRMTSRSLP